MSVQLPSFISRTIRPIQTTAIGNVLPRWFVGSPDRPELTTGSLGIVSIQSYEGTGFSMVAKPTISISEDGKILASNDPYTIRENIEIMTEVLTKKDWLNQDLSAPSNPYIDSTGAPIASFKYKNLGYKWSLGFGIFGITTGLIALKTQGTSNKIFMGCSSISSIVLACREFKLNKIYNWKQLEAHPKPQPQNSQNELSLLQRIYQYNRKAINPAFEDSLEGLRWAGNSLAEESKATVSHVIPFLKNSGQETKNNAVKILAAEFLWKSIQEALATAEARRLEDERNIKALADKTTTTGDVVKQALKIPRALLKTVCSLF